MADISNSNGSTYRRYNGAEAWLYPNADRNTDTLRTIAVNRLRDGSYCVVDGVYSTVLDIVDNTRVAYAGLGYRSIPADRLLAALKDGKLSSHGRAPFGIQGIQQAFAFDLTPADAREFGCELSAYTDQEGNDHTGFIVISAWAYMQLTNAKLDIGPSAENSTSVIRHESLADWLPMLRAEDSRCMISLRDSNVRVFGMPPIDSGMRDEKNAQRVAGSIYQRSNSVIVAPVAPVAPEAAPLKSQVQEGFNRSGWRRS